MSTFCLDEDQRQIQESMHRFAVDVMRPIARDCDEEASLPEDFLARAWDLGIGASSVPECFGGYATPRSALNNAIMTEELAYGDLGLAWAVLAPQLCVLPLLEMGSVAQQGRYLPPFCGESYAAGSLALMERRVGFDPSDLRTTAIRRGGTYVIDGTKCLVPLMRHSPALIVVVSEVTGGGIPGCAAFIVEPTARGVTIEGPEKNMGLSALANYSVRFEGCEVPAENRLGAFDYNRLLALGRIGLAAGAVGVATAVKDYSIAYAKERPAFGYPIATRQTIAFMLADMAIEVDSCRMLTWKAAWAADRGDNPQRLAFLAKGYAAEQSFRIADAGVSILGGHGLIREHPVEMWFRNARAFCMLEGLLMV